MTWAIKTWRHGRSRGRPPCPVCTGSRKVSRMARMYDTKPSVQTNKGRATVGASSQGPWVGCTVVSRQVRDASAPYRTAYRGAVGHEGRLDGLAYSCGSQRCFIGATSCAAGGQRAVNHDSRHGANPELFRPPRDLWMMHI